LSEVVVEATSHMQVFVTAEHLGICMEFANGGDLVDLHTYLTQRKTLLPVLPENMALRLFQQLIVAVNYCHSQLNVSNMCVLTSYYTSKQN